MRPLSLSALIGGGGRWGMTSKSPENPIRRVGRKPTVAVGDTNGR
jgi:hypothetical protein